MLNTLSTDDLANILHEKGSFDLQRISRNNKAQYNSADIIITDKDRRRLGITQKDELNMIVGKYPNQMFNRSPEQLGDSINYESENEIENQKRILEQRQIYKIPMVKMNQTRSHPLEEINEESITHSEKNTFMTPKDPINFDEENTINTPGFRSRVESNYHSRTKQVSVLMPNEVQDPQRIVSFNVGATFQAAMRDNLDTPFEAYQQSKRISFNIESRDTRDKLQATPTLGIGGLAGFGIDYISRNQEEAKLNKELLDSSSSQSIAKRKGFDTIHEVEEE